MSEPTPFDSLVRRILDGQAQLSVRMAAARGALPLARAALVELFLYLRNDPQEEVRAEAENSLRSLEPEAVREIVSDAACPAPVLLHFAPLAARNEPIAEALAFHPHAPDGALAILAAEGNASIIELVLTNQERLLACQGLLDKLTMNPALRQDQRGRILDILARFFRESSAQDAEAAGPAEVAALGALADPEHAARLLEIEVGELFAASEILDGEEFEKAEDPVIRSVYRKILTLNTAQKAMLALRGGREERTILVRDTNKLVALCVMKNPRLTEIEVERIATMRNVSDEVLRTIGVHREWSKAYTVVAALVRNPRTPPGISTNFVPRLTNRDLKGLASDKNVPEIIRRNAKRTFDLRNQEATHAFRKKK